MLRHTSYRQNEIRPRAGEDAVVAKAFTQRIIFVGREVEIYFILSFIYLSYFKKFLRHFSFYVLFSVSFRSSRFLINPCFTFGHTEKRSILHF